ncbi:ATP-binding cassette domain-containing protein [Sediminibacillus massiliensis]|uniref:ATP-binding cassette domain-containing protein n=1 Tax=Sediminibacillus massiliensis TaxID=1926277 RepID=UPI0009884C43|nr:ATP-binding cassette domain-containing protein [Sediminibacillus massiliensis]
MLEVNIRKKLNHFDLKMDFEVCDELVVLFGPSGSGKTTVLRTIAGIEKPEHGRITLHNKYLFKEGGIHLPPQKRKVGYVFQEYALFPHMSIENNVMYGIPKKQRPIYKEHVSHLMNVLGIGHLAHHSPLHISGGEKQRVAVARALANKPDILLLDEPFSALDEETRLQGHAEILRLKKEWRIPAILVTHDREEAEKLGDRIIFMKEGQEVL